MKTKRMKQFFVGLCAVGVILTLFSACRTRTDPTPPDPTEERHPVTVNITPAGTGTVTITPEGPQYAGTLMTINVSPAEGYRVLSVAIPGPGGLGALTTVTVGEEYELTMLARAVVVNVTFEALPDPDRDLAFGSTAANARLSVVRTVGAAAPIYRAFDGYWHTFAQVQGSENAHWFAVDLGDVYDVQVVRVVWGLGDGTHGAFDGMVNYVVQVSTTLDELPPHGNWDDDGWEIIETVSNPGNDGINVRADQERVNTIRFDAPVSARFVRIKQIAGLNAGAAAAPDRPWTNWPSVSKFQVFATDYENIPSLVPPIPPISSLPIGSAENRIDVPVWRAAPPALNVNLAADDAGFTAMLTEIYPAVTGTFSPGQAYTYYFTLEITGDRPVLPTVVPTVFLSTPTAAQSTVIVSVNGQDWPLAEGVTLDGPIAEMVVRRVNPATASNVVNTLTFGLGAPYAGGDVPTYTALAPAGALYSGTIAFEESPDGTAWTPFTGATFTPGMHYRFNIELETTEHYVFYENIVIPAVGVSPATGIVRTATTLSFTYTFGATEGATIATITGGNLVVAGLTARAEFIIGDTTVTTSNFVPGETVNVRVQVTGESERASIFTARLASDEVSSFTFVPSFDLGAGLLSSPISTRNIGGIGRALAGGAGASGGAFVGEPIGERIGEITAGTTIYQPANHWTFVFEFTMPSENVTLSLVDTFRHDIAPSIVAAANGENVIASTMGVPSAAALGYFASANQPRNVFGGGYAWGTNDNHDRWVTLTNPTNSWLVVDLGAEYYINDVVLRWHSGNAFPTGGFRIDVRSDGVPQEVWTATSETPEYLNDRNDWIGTWGDAPEPGETCDAGWQTAWSLLGRTAGGGAVSRHTAFFGGYGDLAVTNLQSTLNGAVGPWQPRDSDMGTVFESPEPLRGRFIKIHMGGGQVGGTGVGHSIWNFEIYGTPVTP